MSPRRVAVPPQPPGETATVEFPRPFGHAFREGVELSLYGWPPDAALLVREGARARGVIAASAETLSVEELFGLVLSGLRTGKLVYARGEVRKTVSFRDGQVVFATSSEPWERLGAAVVSMKLCTRAQVVEALREVGAGVKLGQVLTRTGLLTAARLYAAMGELVREIVLNLFCEREGQLLFLEGAPLPDDVVKLPASTRELALQGSQRAEELLRLERRFPRERTLAAGPHPPPPGSEPLVQRAAGGVPVQALREHFEGSAHTFFQQLDGLVQRGVLVEQAAGAAPAQPAEAKSGRPAPLPVVERYRALVRAISVAVVQAGRDLEDLRSFLADPLPGMETAFAGVSLSEDGELDAARILANLGAETAAGRARAYEVLDAFVSYALFSARNVLPADVSERLSQQARRLQEGTP